MVDKKEPKKSNKKSPKKASKGKYKALRPIVYKGVFYQKGDILELESKEAKVLGKDIKKS